MKPKDLAKRDLAKRDLAKKDLAKAVAKQTRQSPAKAQDEIDVLVHRILRLLREGKEVKLPGVGKLVCTPVKTRNARS